MSKQQNNFRKALWAIDPFNRNESTQNGVANVLRSLGRSLDLEIHPISVVNETQLKHSKDLALKKLRGRLQKFSIAQLEAPKFIFTSASKFPFKRAVSSLLRYARHHKFDFILVGTRDSDTPTKETLPMGKFAKVLSKQSETAVLFISP